MHFLCASEKEISLFGFRSRIHLRVPSNKIQPLSHVLLTTLSDHAKGLYFGWVFS